MIGLVYSFDRVGEWPNDGGSVPCWKEWTAGLKLVSKTVYKLSSRVTVLLVLYIWLTSRGSRLDYMIYLGSWEETTRQRGGIV